MANRFDSATSLRNVVRTPQGGLRAPAALTRVGVFRYRQPDGSTIRELRPPEEVFAPESLASLASAPVTHLHPSEPVTAKTWRTVSVGHVAEGSVREDDARFVTADVIVQDEHTVARIDDGELREVSCGYSCSVDQTPGEYRGERYDQVQRNIRYNHVAIGPRNWGRAGNEVQLRVDSDDAIMLEPELPADEKGPENMTVKIRIDGRELDYGSEEHVGLIEAERDEARKRADSAEGRADAAEARTKELETQVAELSDTARFDSAVAERATLIASARRIAGDGFKADGLSSAEIVAAALKAVDVSVEGKSEDYARARFDAALAHLDAGAPSKKVAEARKAADEATTAPRNDSAVLDARKAMEEALCNRYKEGK